MGSPVLLGPRKRAAGPRGKAGCARPRPDKGRFLGSGCRGELPVAPGLLARLCRCCINQKKCYTRRHASRPRRRSIPATQAQARAHGEEKVSLAPGLENLTASPRPWETSPIPRTPRIWSASSPRRDSSKEAKGWREAGEGGSRSVKRTGIPRRGTENQGAPPPPPGAINKGKCL